MMFPKASKISLVAVSAWLAIAVVFAIERSPCGTLFSAQCRRIYWNILGDVVLLKWVYDYQTLIGGLCALAAGAFVLIANRETNRAAIETRIFEEELAEAAEIDDMKKRLHLLAVEFNVTGSHLREGRPDWPGSSWKWLDDQSLHIADYDPEILEVARFAQSFIVMDIQSTQSLWIGDMSYDNAKRSLCRSASAVAYAAQLIIQQVADEEPSDEIVSRRGTFDPHDLKSVLRSLGKTRADLRDLDYFFDWAAHAATPNSSA